MDRGTQSNGEWIAVESYMGLFERVNFLHEKELITLDYIQRFYGYRYANIYCNPVINHLKLVCQADGWEDFLDLGRKLDVPRRYRNAFGRAENSARGNGSGPQRVLFLRDSK